MDQRTGAGHYRAIWTVLADVLGVSIGTGYLAKVVAKVSDALAGPYAELAGALPAESYVGSDETGHKDHGRRRGDGGLQAGQHQDIAGGGKNGGLATAFYCWRCEIPLFRSG